VIALLDINLLIALFDSAHVHHRVAHNWLAKNAAQGWATCPITQNGCVRVMSQSQYPGRLPVSDIVRRLSAAVDSSEHTFWPDSISLCDQVRFDHTRALTNKSLTDIYLLALAVENGGRLVTFDRTISRGAVAQAQPRRLVVL
jgi:hypothetical protein